MTQLWKQKYVPLILVLTLVLLVTAVSISAASDVSAPEVTSVSPAADSVIGSTGVSISFTVTDPDLISNNNYFIKLDGTTLSSKFEYRGHVETDTCGGQYWVIDSYNQATITGNAAGLKDGTHFIEVRASDRLGNPVTKSWSFQVAAKPLISDMTPANGSTAIVNNSISVRITDDTRVAPDSVALIVDNNPVNPLDISFNSTTGTVHYTVPAPGLANGNHTVTVTARDTSGNESSAMWSFNLQTLGEPLEFAQSGTTFTIAEPVLNIAARSNAKLDDKSATILVDGNAVTASFNYKGHWVEQFELEPYWQVDSYNEGTISGTPTRLTDGEHTLAVTISDCFGSKSTGNWRFKIKAVPAFTAPVPANGQNTTDNAGFSVKISDNDAIVPASITAVLDGTTISGLFNPDSGLFTYQPDGGLSNGTHSVKMSAQDTTGNIASFTWSFTVQTTGPEMTFANDEQTFESCKPEILVNLKSNIKLVDTSVTMQIDGQPANAAFTYKGHWEEQFELDPYWAVDSYGEGTLSFVPVLLEDGTHKMVISAKDILGNISSKTFHFTIAQKPIFSAMEPANGTTIDTRSPTIRINAADPNGTINKDTIRVFVDTQPISPIITDSGTGVNISFKTPTLSMDSYHTVSASVTDNSGIAAATEWKFYVNAQGDMPLTPKDCGSCHTLNQYDKYVHTMGPLGIGINNASPTHFYGNSCDHCHNSYSDKTCGYCHGADIFPPYDDPAWVRPTPNPALSSGEDCLYCHSTNNGGWVPSEYAADHFYLIKNMINTGLDPIKPLYPDLNYIVRHDILPTHKIDKGACNECHSLYLTREHNKKDKTGQQMTCVTCHASEDTRVKEAIAGKKRDCSACHGQSDHETVHADELDSSCQTCHKPTLTAEHLNNELTTAGKNYGCDTCHASTSREVSRTIAGGNTNCSGCHGTKTHNLLFAAKVPSDVDLSPDFIWSAPIEADIFAGEFNTPSAYMDGQVVFSNRSTDISLEAVWNFYQQQLTLSGWTVKSGAPGSGATSFAAEFTKGTRTVLVKCYNTENSDGSGLSADTGYRVEIWF